MTNTSYDQKRDRLNSTTSAFGTVLSAFGLMAASLIVIQIVL